MATYYVDLSQVGTGAGTSGSPFNLTQFIAQTFVDNDTYKLKGLIEKNETSIQIGNEGSAFNIVAWDLELYGPWRICNTGGSILFYNNKNLVDLYSKISDGIVLAQEFFFKSHEVSNMFIRALDSGTGNINFFDTSAFGRVIRGCTIARSDVVEVGYFNVYEGVTCHVTDSLIDMYVPPETVVTFNGCLFVEYMPTTGVKNKCQFFWHSAGQIYPTWPAWDADKLLFSKSVLYAIEPNRPPARGDGGGGPTFTGYSTDLFGRRRNDIGAFYYDRHDRIYVHNVSYQLLDGSLTLYDDSVGATSWTWKIGSTVVSTAQNPTIGNSIAAYVDEIIEIEGVSYLPVTLLTNLKEQACNIRIVWNGITSNTFNDVSWDQSTFVMVGDNGTIATTEDGSLLTFRPVPPGVEQYKLTGVYAKAGCYKMDCVVVGTKTVSPGNYKLLILTSTDFDTWTIESEMPFASIYDPAISQIKVTWGFSYVIYGSTLHVITGNPGDWSAPITLPIPTPNRPIKSLVYSDNKYYALFTYISCPSIALMLYEFDYEFTTLLSTNTISDTLAGEDFRVCPLFYDSLRGMYVTSYNDYSGNFVISTSIDLSTWTKEIEIASTKYPNGSVCIVDPGSGNSIYIVGGNLTTSGIIYAYNLGWTDVTSGQVSLNAIAAKDDGETILAVGYQGAVVVL